MKKIDDLISKLERKLIKMQEAEESSRRDNQPLNVNYFKGVVHGLDREIRDLKELNESLNIDIKSLLQ